MKEQTKFSRRDLMKFSSVAMAGAYLAGAKALLATANETPTVTFHKAISYIEGEISAKTFPGAALLVVRRGEKLLERYWGTYCSVNDREAPLTAAVLHPLFSFSKVISATAIALAHQNRLLDYDAPIHTYIPEYRGGWKDLITLRKLLTHSAGIPKCPLKGVYSPEEWQKGLEVCYAAPVEWEPGSKTEYHGLSGMFLAAEATRRVMGLATWEEICRKLVFEPLGAEGFSFRIPEGKPVALTPQPKKLPAEIRSVAPWALGHPGAGGFGRLDDMIRLLQLHLNRGVWNGRTIMDKDEWQEMHRIQYEAQIARSQKYGEPRAHEPWGLGWMIRRDVVDHSFGLGRATSPQTFGHAGIDTLISVGEPERQIALVLIITDSPNENRTSYPIMRNMVTNLVMEEIS